MGGAFYSFDQVPSERPYECLELEPPVSYVRAKSIR